MSSLTAESPKLLEIFNYVRKHNKRPFWMTPVLWQTLLGLFDKPNEQEGVGTDGHGCEDPIPGEDCGPLLGDRLNPGIGIIMRKVNAYDPHPVMWV
ncbi:hypothetical protein RIF29_21526 [Crotalaria pallida]|uniref:Uncharacterized protein n=1 Tax=Crotalaria pallida TaxID=3830 RepID=A0AAN9F2V1_CROPI